jgi:hypothetical protein
MTQDEEVNANVVDRRQNVKMCSRLHRFKLGQLFDSNEDENVN